MAILKRPPNAPSGAPSGAPLGAPPSDVPSGTPPDVPTSGAMTQSEASTLKPPSGFFWGLKILFERIAALVIIVLISPLLLLITVAILISSGRPVLFAQPRFGRDALPFDIYKFRTMRADLCDVSGAGQTSDRDPRITKVGMILRKTSVDELPQLFNVLLGDMNIIGPRAHPCGMEVNGVLCEQVDERYQARHLIAPGITGWAQVNGSRGAVKSARSLERRVSLDLWYIKHWSLWLDLRICFKTLGVLIHRDKGQ